MQGYFLLGIRINVLIYDNSAFSAISNLIKCYRLKLNQLISHKLLFHATYHEFNEGILPLCQELLFNYINCKI